MKASEMSDNALCEMYFLSTLLDDRINKLKGDEINEFQYSLVEKSSILKEMITALLISENENLTSKQAKSIGYDELIYNIT